VVVGRGPRVDGGGHRGRDGRRVIGDLDPLDLAFEDLAWRVRRRTRVRVGVGAVAAGLHRHDAALLHDADIQVRETLSARDGGGDAP